MMDEHLRDNVARLLEGRAKAPSAGFLERLDARLSPAPPRRHSLLFAAAAALILGVTAWALLRSDGGGSSNNPAGTRPPIATSEGVAIVQDVPQLNKDLAAFIEKNDYWMSRPCNSRVTSKWAREAIDLSDRVLQGPWQSSIDLLIKSLDDETVIPSGWGPRLRCQNALTLLVEITDRGMVFFHGPSDTPESKARNGRIRDDWKAWWQEMKSKPPETWCFGLTPAEKAQLKRSWLPPIGEFENNETQNPTQPTPDGLEFVRKLGRKAVPFLLHSICIDPPRNTLWETGNVEWNAAALALLEAATGGTQGAFDLEDKKADGKNKPVLEKWRARWAAEQQKPRSGGSVKGTILFKGERPKPKLIKIPDSDYPLPAETLTIAKSGGIRHVAVFVEGPETPAWVSAPQTLEMMGKRFQLRVIFISPKKVLTIANQESMMDCAHSGEGRNPEVNVSIKPGGCHRVSFEMEERISMKSDLNPWKQAWIFVTTNPLHASTDEEGRFEISDVPAGKWKLKVWHEKLGEQTLDIEVNDGQVTELNEIQMALPK